MLNQENQARVSEIAQVSTPTSSSDEGIYTEEDNSQSHKPVEFLRRKDRSKSESCQEFGNSTFQSKTVSGDFEFSEEAIKKFAKLSGAYEELCKKTITIVHAPSDASMLSGSENHDDVFQSCDTVHNLPSKCSRNNLLPQQDDDGRWKQRQFLNFPRESQRKAGRDSIKSVSLKPAYRKSIYRLMTRMIVETLLSYVRNIGCYLFFVCFVSIVILHPQPVLMSRPDYEIDVVLLLIGSLILSWQIFNVIKQAFKFKTSVLQEVLMHNLADAEEFEEIVRKKRSSPPYLTLELKVKKLSAVACFLFSCCTCCRRGMDNLMPKRHCTVLYFDSWFDASYIEYRKASKKPSASIEEGQQQSSIFQGVMPSTPHMVIISKDCKLYDQTTSSSIDQEAKTVKTLFSEDLELDESHVTSEINVDVQEGLRFPDVEAFLIVDTLSLERGRKNSKTFFARHPFFSTKMLLFFSLLALDSLYYTIFLLKCLKPTRFCVVKYVKRSALSRLVEESSDQESS